MERERVCGICGAVSPHGGMCRVTAECRKAERRRRYEIEWSAHPKRSREQANAGYYSLDWRAAYYVRVFLQGGLCALCDKPEWNRVTNGKPIRLGLDHDHECCPYGSKPKSCGKCVRLYLCQICNGRIGNHEKHGTPVSFRDQVYLAICRRARERGELIQPWRDAYAMISRGAS